VSAVNAGDYYSPALPSCYGHNAMLSDLYSGPRGYWWDGYYHGWDSAYYRSSWWWYGHGGTWQGSWYWSYAWQYGGLWQRYAYGSGLSRWYWAKGEGGAERKSFSSKNGDFANRLISRFNAARSSLAV